MKKILIGSLVGAVILFAWSGLAWEVLPVHRTTFSYTDTATQNSLLQVMANSNLASGVYVMPMADNTKENYKEEKKKMMDANKGKPWAAVQYQKEGYMEEPTTPLFGFIYDFIAVLAACILLAGGMSSSASFFSRWWLVMMVAVVICFHQHMEFYNWMHYPWNYTRDMLLDTALGWAINGLWLSWWFGRK